MLTEVVEGEWTLGWPGRDKKNTQVDKFNCGIYAVAYVESTLRGLGLEVVRIFARDCACL